MPTGGRNIEVLRVESVDLDEVAGMVADLHRSHGLQFACDLGRLLIDELFDGSAFRARRLLGTSTSLRMLAAREDVPVSLTTLSLSIRVADQVAVLGDEVSNQLTVSHHHELLRIHHIPTRRRLAKQAADDALSVRALRSLVSEARPQTAPRRGRPPRPAAVKLLDQLDRTVQVNASLVEDLDDKRRAQVRRRLKRHIDALNKLMELL